MFDTTTYRTARRVVVAVLGGTIVLLGIALLALPGPGLLVILGGLALLGLEFAWARHTLRRVKDGASSFGDAVRRRTGGGSTRPAAPPSHGESARTRGLS